MPWQETEPMKERQQFIIDYRSGLYSITELCDRFGIRRKTGYKWLARFEHAGLAGLADHSRAPHSSPHRTGPDIVALIRSAREQHPHWGPRKLRPWMVRHYPEQANHLPAVSTIGDILKREGLVRSAPRRRRWPHPNPDLRAPTVPNQLWSADFKGQFRLANGQECYPLTIEDGYSRTLPSVLIGSSKHRSTNRARAGADSRSAVRRSKSASSRAAAPKAASILAASYLRR